MAAKPGIPPFPPPPPAGRQNNAVWWIIGIVAGLIALTVIGGILVALYTVHNVRVSKRDNSVEIETPAGKVRVQKSAGHASGLPVYPGAVASSDHGGNMSIGLEGSRVGLAAEHYTTGDALSKVAEWYRNRLGPAFHQEGPGHNSGIVAGDAEAGRHDLAFVDDHGDAARVVALKAVPSGTAIDLVRVGKQEVQ